MVPVFRRNIKEVDPLARRPYEPVKHVNCGKLLFKLAPT